MYLADVEARVEAAGQILHVLPPARGPASAHAALPSSSSNRGHRTRRPGRPYCFQPWMSRLLSLRVVGEGAVVVVPRLQKLCCSDALKSLRTMPLRVSRWGWGGQRKWGRVGALEGHVLDVLVLGGGGRRGAAAQGGGRRREQQQGAFHDALLQLRSSSVSAP